jgi:predicted transcriptional regulator
MEKMKKLPDAEFEIMKVVWANTPPITANIIMQQHGSGEGWKVQTAISLLLRLVERGFLRTEKNGKERTYFPLLNKEDYLKFETGNFMKQFHDNSFLNLVNTLYGDEALTDEDIDELLKWAKERKA